MWTCEVDKAHDNWTEEYTCKKEIFYIYWYMSDWTYHYVTIGELSRGEWYWISRKGGQKGVKGLLEIFSINMEVIQAVLDQVQSIQCSIMIQHFSLLDTSYWHLTNILSTLFFSSALLPLISNIGSLTLVTNHQGHKDPISTDINTNSYGRS